MEKELILKWLNNHGSGDGSGYGYGYGDGSGSGSGSGEKLIKLNGEDIYYIDNVPTIITAILGNYAKGYIVGVDYQLTPCYVAKSPNGLFAHGKDLHEAEQALITKISESMTEEERINLFCQTFKKGEKYKGTEFFDWHNRLTGSCLFGRNEFVKNHGLSLEDAYTVEEFIALTENAYGGCIIKELKKNFDGVEKSIFKSAENVNLDSILGWEKNGVKTKYLEVYDEE